ncbi:hypothetical protein INT43_000389 [Umbelopsis isabellina]|uniref:Uncharacterized protein n=1 Tax=Mortierella isabellina TaxID=91625 RepID=A0A8H7Q2S6_MORIS|nr:hypothetical protein INT43_000389 [Umbelopsis isabellina]
MQSGTDKPYEQGEESKVVEDPQREDSVDHSNMPETPESSNTTPSQQAPPPVQQQQQHATWQHQPHALHMLSKFATIHGGDKYHQDLRRDLLTNFDRNLTVETAHFEPQAHSSAGPTNASSSAASMRRGPISYQGGMGSSSTLTDRPKASAKKRRRPAPTSGTASPAEVFHRHLVDAVSNAEDSEENEGYVYPYAYSNSSLQDSVGASHSNGPPLQQIDSVASIASAPATANESSLAQPGHSTGSTSDLFSDMFQPPLPRPSATNGKDDQDQDPEWQYEDYHRPKMRNVVPDRDHYMRSSRIRPFSRNTDQYRRKYDKTRGWSGVQSDMEGYTTDDESVPLLSRKNFRPGQLKKRILECPQILFTLLLGIGLFLGCLTLLASWTALPLRSVEIKMGRVLATDKELIFDLKVHASNTNWWTINVPTADLGVFASSKIVPDGLPLAGNYTSAAEPAEYLGSLYRFDESLSFPARMFSSDKDERPTTQLRIKSPGADKGGNERWSRLIRYPYALIVRGVLRYRLLPFWGAHLESVAVCHVALVNPATGKVSDDPDQSYCLSGD